MQNPNTNKEMEEWLSEVITSPYYSEDNEDEDSEDYVPDIRTFEETGLLTRNRGIVVRFPNGSEFQLTIVQSQIAEE